MNQPQRLHWTAYILSFLALIALFLSEGSSYILPFLGVALLASIVIPARHSGSSAPIWMLRIALWGAIFALHMMRPENTANTFFDTKLSWLGEPLMAELVLQVWKSRPEGGGRGVVTLFLSGLVFLIACDITEDAAQLPFRFPFTLYLAPAYMLFLVLSMRHYRIQEPLDGQNSLPALTSAERLALQRAARTRYALYVVMVAVAIGLGVGLHHTLRRFRSELTYMGMRLLAERQASRSSGLSTTPRLGPTDGLKGSTERVALIHGASLDSHWRVLAFSRYNRGNWGPSRETRKYDTYAALLPSQKSSRTQATVLTVERLSDNYGLLYTPLHTVSLEPLQSGELQWSVPEGGPLFVKPALPGDYTIVVSSDDAYQGILCTPLTAEERVKLLEVPSDVDPRVGQLANSIVGGITKPQARADAIEHYLLTNYKYSLKYHPGSGDPVSKFILSHSAAHCEYFGSAAVILLRSVGIPARYVIGYYAHEGAGPGVTVLRQRDAHAWAECWIEGQGWVAVDGTPGGGRPDELAGPVPGWQRALEWVQDNGHRVQEWLAGPNGVKVGAVIGIIAFIALGWQWRKQSRRAPVEKVSVFAYAESREELTALFARFELLSKTKGLVCPPPQTWQEYLASPVAITAAQTSGFDTALAQKFIEDYYHARFGLSPTPETLTELKSLLTRLV